MDLDEFIDQHNLVGDLLNKDMFDLYQSLPHYSRPTFLYPILLSKIKEDPDFELWERHYQWDFIKKGKRGQGFFESPHLFISSHGRVYNSKSGNFLKGSTKGGKGDYLRHNDTISGRNIRIHRAVACMFVGNYTNKPLTKLLVNHKDLDKQHNFFANLEWCTQKGNTHHAIDELGSFSVPRVYYLCEVVKGGQFLNHKFIISGEVDCKKYRMTHAYLAAKDENKTCNNCKVEVIDKSEVDDRLLIKNQSNRFKGWLKKPKR
ncbi:hypothetical protein [Photobacterium phage PDCC-1]|uniref:HNH endonuclease n=2 Tax=Aphroditevirus TaxID=2560092 RepID=A0A6B9J209_9CAUD|nr:HNH endonuclease [Vibrio phage 2 TSL-2019]YP_009853548.1 HNH endonuclease [Photobacterium phage PDCC-1]QAU04174.1 hypothetical protein [Vibrio phage 2 TSL-2019]QGZ14559.1 hypothetical protein [Photobacterium phage PDCC-1]